MGMGKVEFVGQQYPDKRVMFQVSRRLDYAVRILVELGGYPPEVLVNTRVIAKGTGVPKAYLHKITADLVKAGLVHTTSGPAGGLNLLRTPKDITMLQIMEAMEGPLLLNICLLRPRECPRDVVCPAHGFWGNLQATVCQQLQATTLESLVIEAKRLKWVNNPNHK